MCVYSSTIRIKTFGSSPFHPQSACCSSVMQTTALCSSLRHCRNDEKKNPVICIFDIWRNLIHNNHVWKLNSIHIHIYLFFRIFLCVIVLYHIHRKTVQQPISAIIMQRHLRGKHPTHRAPYTHKTHCARTVLKPNIILFNRVTINFQQSTRGWCQRGYCCCCCCCRASQKSCMACTVSTENSSRNARERASVCEHVFYLS